MLLRELNNSLFKEDKRAFEEISSTSGNSRTALEIDTIDHLDEIDVRIFLSGFNLSDKSDDGVVSILVVGDWDVRTKEVSNGAKSAVTFFQESFRFVKGSFKKGSSVFQENIKKALKGVSIKFH